MSKHNAPLSKIALTNWQLLMLFILALIASIAVFHVSAYQGLSSTSVEVGFTDASPNGLEIVPASCASAPPATSDSGGYVISNGAAGADINANADEFCVTNSTGNTYFLPTHSLNEMQSFQNAAPNLGMTVGPPSSFPY